MESNLNQQNWELFPWDLPEIAAAPSVGKDNNGQFHIHYRATQTLLNTTEFQFYLALIKCIDLNKYTICPKVRIADIVYYAGKSNYYSGFLRVANKHVDFVIIRNNTAEILVAIELDGWNHTRKKKTIERDEFVNEVFSTANLPLVRFKVQAKYDLQEIRQKLKMAYITAKSNAA